MMNLLSRPVTGILFAALFATSTTAQVDLDFKGGSIQEYVQVVRKAIDAQSKYERPNVLLKGPAGEVMLTKNVSPETSCRLGGARTWPCDRVRSSLRSSIVPTWQSSPGSTCDCLPKRPAR